MSENASELTSQYTAQVSADLERNAKEQQRIGAEIAALQEQLAAHQRDHAVLLGIQQALAAAPAAAKPSALPDSAAVPAPRTVKKSGEAGTAKRARPQAKKAAPAPRRSADKPVAEKKSAKAVVEKNSGKPVAEKDSVKTAPAKTAQPTLVELIRGHLTEQREPRSAAEIATALGKAHPDRSVKTTVVRTTLEGLVAKSQAHRSKQGTSVFYTAAAVPEQKATPPAESQPAPANA
ncbi:cell division septum initiation protein DivIVA [Streptomyces sp. 3330]|uniref:hypothetical protein n=1 Tax=Streptomyces sp. 3330 TaxID=2817755 RepID=UPI002866198A|nr:hypothetical protein [Streptomyces sp. 3330]MDR6974352.1 cell division septum initiation protein DivIVA [Streptomyces sp. 3330]